MVVADQSRISCDEVDDQRGLQRFGGTGGNRVEEAIGRDMWLFVGGHIEGRNFACVTLDQKPMCWALGTCCLEIGVFKVGVVVGADVEVPRSRLSSR